MSITKAYIEILKAALRRTEDTGYEQEIAYNGETQQFDYFAAADRNSCLNSGFEVVESVAGETSHCGLYADGQLVESAVDDLVDDWHVISLIS